MKFTMKSNDKQDAKPLIIGYGNPLRGDDALGHVIVTQLQAELDPTLATFMCCQQLTLDLAEDIAQASQVILVDAALNGEAGALTIRTITPSRTATHTLEHHMTPAALITAVSVLYDNVPPVTLVSLVGQQWQAGTGLSEMIRNTLPEAIHAIENLLDNAKQKDAI